MTERRASKKRGGEAPASDGPASAERASKPRPRQRASKPKQPDEQAAGKQPGKRRAARPTVLVRKPARDPDAIVHKRAVTVAPLVPQPSVHGAAAVEGALPLFP